MRSRLTTQLGWRSIQKHWKWVEPSEAEARLWRDMEDGGMNHDITPPSKMQHVTFRNTHSIFADIIQAEIFEPNLSNAIPDTSHIFARSVPFR